jgi:multiple sugar transport system permease protein
MRNIKIRKHRKMNVFFAAILVVLILYTALMFGLFLLGINISLKHPIDVDVYSNIFGLPNMKIWETYKASILGNYFFAFQNIKLDKANGYIVGLFNKERVDAPIKGDLVSCSIYTIIYAGIGALCSSFMPMFMGYLCAMYRNKASAIIYAVVLFVIATPIVGATPSTVNLMRSLRLYDTFIGEFMRRSTFTNMYFLIFFAYFSGLSSGFSEAAEIDGASQLSIMFRIYMPLAMNIFFTVYLMVFVAYWNDFTTPMMFLPSKPTLSYAIDYTTTLDSGSNLNYATRRMAALMVFAIPIIVIFTIFNKRLMTNLTMGGVKE